MIHNYSLVFPTFKYVDSVEVIRCGVTRRYSTYKLIWKDTGVASLPEKYEQLLKDATYAISQADKERIIQLAADANKEFLLSYPEPLQMQGAFANIRIIAAMLQSGYGEINNYDPTIEHLIVRKFWCDQPNYFEVRDDFVESLSSTIKYLKEPLTNRDDSDGSLKNSTSRLRSEKYDRFLKEIYDEYYKSVMRLYELKNDLIKYTAPRGLGCYGLGKL